MLLLYDAIFNKYMEDILNEGCYWKYSLTLL